MKRKRKRKSRSDTEQEGKPAPRKYRSLIDSKEIATYLEALLNARGTTASCDVQGYLEMFQYNSVTITEEFSKLVARAFEWYTGQIVLVLEEMLEWKDHTLDKEGKTLTGAVVAQAVDHIDTLGNSKN